MNFALLYVGFGHFPPARREVAWPDPFAGEPEPASTERDAGRIRQLATDARLALELDLTAERE